MICLAEIIATFFYCGLIPWMPGTFGTFAGLLVWFFIAALPFVVKLFIVGAVFFIGVVSATLIELTEQKKDPSKIVIDEVVGIWLALLFIPYNPLYCFLAFCLFRFFDITKPFPIGLVERSFQRGWGIMLDDCIAGCLSGGICWLIYNRYLPIFFEMRVIL